MTPAQISEAFYSLACSYFVSVGTRRSFIVLRGLSENMNKALTLLESLLSEAVADPEVYQTYVETVLKGRADAKANQNRNFRALSSYVNYGPELLKETFVGEEELRTLDPKKLTASLSDLLSLKHRIIYYGPLSQKQVEADLAENHLKGVALREPAPMKEFKRVQPTETVIYVAPYDAKQLYMMQMSDNGKKFDASITPSLNLYNDYFGGSMNAIVFQEMREARSLAYSAYATLAEPSRLNDDYFYYTQIATQNDKLMDAIGAFNDIINNMPESQGAFDLAKESIDKRLRTERVIDDNIAWAYINALDLGIAPRSPTRQSSPASTCRNSRLRLFRR